MVEPAVAGNFFFTVIIKSFLRNALPEYCLLTLLWVPVQLHACSFVGSHPWSMGRRKKHLGTSRTDGNCPDAVEDVKESFLPSGNCRLNNPEVCWTESVHTQSLECWQKEDDNYRSHLEIKDWENNEKISNARTDLSKALWVTLKPKCQQGPAKQD